MTENMATESLRRWLPLPSLAIPVRASIQDEGSHDALQAAVLKLLRLRPRSTEELAGLMGLSDQPDLVDAALLRLSVHGYVQEQGEQTRTWRYSESALDQGPVEMVQGWIILAPPDARPIPRLWLGGSPPPDPGRDSLSAHWVDHKQQQRRLRGEVRPGEVQRALNGLVISGRILAIDRPRIRRGEGEVEGRRVKLRSLLLARETRDGDWKVGCRSWVAADLLPVPTGLPTRVLHEPDIWPGGLPDRPVSAGLWSWLETAAPAMRDELERTAEEMKVASSLVLSLAGIKDEAELERQIERHCEEQAARLGLGRASAPPQLSRLEERIKVARRWLVIAMRDHKHHAQARDAYAHAVEELMSSLAHSALDLIQPWLEARTNLSKQQRKAADRAVRSGLDERLSEFGLKGRLGPTEQYLREHLSSSMNRLAKALEEGQHGAGENLSIWTMALVLPEERVAAAHAGRVRAALVLEPRLFELMDELIRVRNTVVHHREEEGLPPMLRQPEAVDDRLARVWSALCGAG